jgi:hypothetical protein
MLSTKSLNLLADKIAPQVADIVQNDPAVMEVMLDAITGAVFDVLEETDEMIVAEVAMMVSERLALVAH